MGIAGWAAASRRRIAFGLIVPLSIGVYACVTHDSPSEPIERPAAATQVEDPRSFVADSAGWSAWNARSAFRARVTTEGLRIEEKTGFAWSLHTMSAGAARRLEANGRHVRIVRDDDTAEDVENRADGIEQSFVVSKRRADLTIDLAIDGPVS